MKYVLTLQQIFAAIAVLCLSVSIEAKTTSKTFKLKKYRMSRFIGVLSISKGHGLKKGMTAQLVLSSKRKCQVTIGKIYRRGAVLYAKNCAWRRLLKKGMNLSLTFDTGQQIKKEKWPDRFFVHRFHANKRYVTAKIPRGTKVGPGDEFNLFSNDNQYCPITAFRATRNFVYIRTTGCKFEDLISEGYRLELKSAKSKKLAPPDKEKKKKESSWKFKRSKDELMYVIFGLGYPSISYGNSKDKANVDGLKQDSQFTHIKIISDVFGLYFPWDNKKTAVGGVMNHKEEPYLRIDVTQHQMHAVILAKKYVYSCE